MIAAVILAAGASSRMGRPKALLAAGSETFLDRLIGIFGACCSPVIVVLGHDSDVIRAGLLRGADAAIVLNPAPAEGQLSSLQCGLRAVPAAAEAVLFTPVDHPGIRRDTIDTLLDVFRRTGAPAVVPVFHGRRGHPVLCSRELASEISALPAGAQARHAVHRPGTVYVGVGDPGVVTDIDEPEDYRRFLNPGAL